MISLPVSIHSQIFWNLIDLAVINNPPEQLYCSFGNQITNGDLNGDGYSDLIISSSAEYPGRVYVFFGGNPFDTLYDLTFINPLNFGHSISSGDVNNDGYDDLAISDSDFRVMLYFGGIPMDTIADWIANKQEPTTSWFGYSIAVSDLNNDSFADIIVGAPLAGGNDNLGAVYIYWGAVNPDTICDVKFYGTDDSNFGWRLSSGYDVNGDNINDLAVGAPTAPLTFPNISIYYGDSSSFDTIRDVDIYNPCNELYYGSSVSLVKDINGDGYDDLVAGANHNNQVYIYYGDNLMDNQFDVILSADTFRFGTEVIGIDNADGDGLGDIVVGCPRYGGEYPYKGRVYLFRGGDPFDSIYDASVQGFPSQEIGWNVGYAGDLDNDGKDEIAFSNEVASFYQHKVWIVKYSEFEIEEDKEIKHKKITLFSPYPNPFIKSTNLRIILPHYDYGLSKCFIDIFDCSGRLIRKEKMDNLVSSILNYEWDGKDDNGHEVSNGVYLIKTIVQSKNSKFEDVRKVTKLK